MTHHDDTLRKIDDIRNEGGARIDAWKNRRYSMPPRHTGCLRKIGDASIDAGWESMIFARYKYLFIYTHVCVYVNIWEKSGIEHSARLDKRAAIGRAKNWVYLTSLEGNVSRRIRGDIDKSRPRNIVFRIRQKAKKYSRYSIVKIG